MTEGLNDSSSDATDDSPAWDLGRREFLVRAAKLGLSATAVAIFLEACNKVAPLGPTSSPTASPLVSPPPTPTPSPTPSAIPAMNPSISSSPRRPYRQVPTPTRAYPSRPTTVPTSSAAGPTATAIPLTPTPVYKESDREVVRIGHLLRRAGFGATAEELKMFVSMGVAATVDYLVDYEKVDNQEVEDRISALNLAPIEGKGFVKFTDLQRWWLLRMIYTKRPLQEKMVLFWHGHLTSAQKKVGTGPSLFVQNELFRQQAMGNYGTLLKAISRDPAMLIWLDSRVNKKSAPNENFARELMELFSIGVGPYTETDVRESARAFTGYFIKQEGRGAERQRFFHFRQDQHDTGTKTFLGRSGNLDGDEVVDTILEHPTSAEFMSRKLFEFFAYDDPEPETIANLASTFRATNYSIKALVRQILTSPEFYSPKAYRAKIKSPPELIVGSIRSLGIETNGFGLHNESRTMGQFLFNPFDVSGWAGGADWINSTTIIQRLNFANQIVSNRRFNYNPHETVANKALSSTSSIVDHYVDVLLDGNMPILERNIILAYSQALDALGDPSSPLLKVKQGNQNPTIDERLRSVVYLILSSPDFQLS